MIRTDVQQIREAYSRRSQLPNTRYSLFDPSQRMAVQEVERRILTGLVCEEMTDLRSRHILDIGCGTGEWLLQYLRWGAQPANVVGVDLIPERVVACQGLVPGARIELMDAANLQLPRDAFDIVLQFTAFTSILDTTAREAAAAEMVRVTKPSGLIVWYDFICDNPRNADVRKVSIHELKRLFDGCRIRTERLTLAPPIARAVAPRSERLCALLAQISWLRTHCLAFIRPNKG